MTNVHPLRQHDAEEAEDRERYDEAKEKYAPRCPGGVTELMERINEIMAQDASVFYDCDTPMDSHTLGTTHAYSCPNTECPRYGLLTVSGKGGADARSKS